MTTLAPSFLNGSSSFVGNKDFHKSLNEFDFPPHPSTRPRSAIGNVSGNRCESDCRARGREFDPGPVPYFRGD